ncbi:MAG: hypothetical protein Wins2KO_30100 [Winogradskyella sp.]
MKKIAGILFVFCIAFANAQSAPAPSYNSYGLKVFFDDSFNDKNLKSEVVNYIYDKGLGSILLDSDFSDINLSFDGTTFHIEKSSENKVVYRIDNSNPSNTATLLKEKIFQYAYGFYINNLNLKNNNYNFSFRIKPVDQNNKEISISNYSKTNGILDFNASGSAAILEVTNLSDNPIYFSIIEINSKGELSGFVPNIGCTLFGNERRIEPRQTTSFETCKFQFAPPYETLTLKGFASPEPINFNPIIRNEDNSSLEYIKDFYTEMFTYEFQYNIVDSNGNMPYETPIETYKPKSSPELELLLSDLELLEQSKGKRNEEYVEKLNEISKLHSVLGNIDEAKTYASIHKKLAKQIMQAPKSSQNSYDRERRKASIRAKRLAMMNDAEKVEFLKQENELQLTEIGYLRNQIKQLNKELETLRKSKDSTTTMRGIIPKEKKRDIGSEYTYRALIIAEQNYEDENIEDLKFPIEDATALKSVLVNNYAFKNENITFLKDPTRKEIFKALENLFQISSEKDHLLIFYAGHGVYDTGFKRGYWLPSDAELESKSSWMSNVEIKDFISSIKTKHTLLISDACFSGSIFEYNRDVTTNVTPKALEKLLKKNARHAMTSGLDKPVPDESVFIKYLLKTLRENKNVHLKASDLFKTIQEVVLNNTENIPQYGVIRNANHEGGEFIFLKRDN